MSVEICSRRRKEADDLRVRDGPFMSPERGSLVRESKPALDDDADKAVRAPRRHGALHDHLRRFLLTSAAIDGVHAVSALK